MNTSEQAGPVDASQHAPVQRQRIDQLDSLRGLAALSVLFYHYLSPFPSMTSPHSPLLKALTYSPAHALWSGSQAVQFFFVLSGFVLALPFLRSKQSYVEFLIKRVCRIYIPLYVAVLGSIVLRHLVYSGDIGELSTWFNGVWHMPPSPRLIANHLLLIGSFQNGNLDPVLWSLVYEMRISLIFPMLTLLVLRTDWKLSLIAGQFAAVLSIVLDHIVKTRLGIQQDYTDTLTVMPMFITGILLAKHRHSITSYLSRLDLARQMCLLCLGVLCYTFPWWASSRVPVLQRTSLIDNSVVTLGVAIFICSAFSFERCRSALLSAPLLLLGRSSYSIYLWHAILLTSLIHMLYGRMPTLAILGLAAALTAAVSYGSYRFIERFSVDAGRGLARHFARRRASREVRERRSAIAEAY